MSSSSEESDDDVPDLPGFVAEISKEWKRKQKLRRKYVNDGKEITDKEYIALVKKHGMEKFEVEEFDDDDIVPTAKEFVWVLGKS